METGSRVGMIQTLHKTGHGVFQYIPVQLAFIPEELAYRTWYVPVITGTVSIQEMVFSSTFQYRYHTGNGMFQYIPVQLSYRKLYVPVHFSTVSMQYMVCPK